MKKVKIIFLCSLFLITSFLLFACKTKIKPTEVYFEETEIEMYLGKSKYLYPKLTPENANYYLFEWTTSNKGHRFKQRQGHCNWLWRGNNYGDRERY